MTKEIVIVGAGAGGGLVASKLRRLIPEDKAHITIIDKYGKTVFQPSQTLVSIGSRLPEQISTDISNFYKRGIKPIKGEVTDVDAANRNVVLSSQKIPYDILVLSPGVKFDKQSFPGYNNVEQFWDLEGAISLRSKLSTFKGGNIVIGVTTKVYKCPPVPWEMAMILDDYFRNKGMRDKVNITVAHFASKPFEMFGPVLSNPVTKWFEERDIHTVNNFNPKNIDGENKKIIGEANETIDYDLAIIAPPHKPQDFIAKNPDLLSKQGWLDSNIKNFRNSKFDDIYGLGDSIAPTVGLGMAGVFAHFQADTVASLIAGDVMGIHAPIPYNTVGLCAGDTGDAGMFAYCDFGDKLTKPDTLFPDCRLVPPDKMLKFAHAIYEKYFLANVYGGWYYGQ